MREDREDYELKAAGIVPLYGGGGGGAAAAGGGGARAHHAPRAGGGGAAMHGGSRRVFVSNLAWTTYEPHYPAGISLTHEDSNGAFSHPQRVSYHHQWSSRFGCKLSHSC